MCHWAGEEALGGYLHRLLPPRAFDGRVTATVQCRELTDGGNTVVDLVRDQAAAWGGASSADGAVALTQRECASRDDVKQWLRFATKRASKRAVARLFEVVVANAESGVRGRLALVQLAPLRDDSNSMQALDAAMSSTIRAINAARDGRALAARPGAAGKGGAPARPNGALAALLSDVIAGAARTVWVLHLDPYAPRGRVGAACRAGGGAKGDAAARAWDDPRPAPARAALGRRQEGAGRPWRRRGPTAAARSAVVDAPVLRVGPPEEHACEATPMPVRPGREVSGT